MCECAAIFPIMRVEMSVFWWCTLERGMCANECIACPGVICVFSPHRLIDCTLFIWLHKSQLLNKHTLLLLNFNFLRHSFHIFHGKFSFIIFWLPWRAVVASEVCLFIVSCWWGFCCHEERIVYVAKSYFSSMEAMKTNQSAWGSGIDHGMRWISSICVKSHAK